jgi:protein-S-isoprenylcysteine O-methyltransferase Ste14
MNRMWLINFPVPEYQLGFLLVGIGLHLWTGAAMTFDTNAATLGIGTVLILVSLLISIWSAISFGEDAMAKPSELRTTGPYRFTRNPMYLSWSIAILGTGVLLGTWWLLAAVPLASIITQVRVISPEESRLTEQFGAEYEAYKNAVSRWIWPI